MAEHGGNDTGRSICRRGHDAATRCIFRVYCDGKGVDPIQLPQTARRGFPGVVLIQPSIEPGARRRTWKAPGNSPS